MIVVEYLKENPILYNRKLKEYKDKTKRDACWGIMAERLGISTEDIKKWFQSMRTVYGKVTITKSGQAQAELTDRQKWVKSSFLFLGSFIARIGKTSGLKWGNSQTTAGEYSDVSRATSPEVEDTPQVRPSTSAGPGAATAFGPSTSQQPRSGTTPPSLRRRR